MGANLSGSDQTTLDPVDLARRLIRCPSVTPKEAGALDLLDAELGALGFKVWRKTFSEEGTEDVENLYARLGEASPNLCFAGHTDVVPVGDERAWSVDPFEGALKDGVLIGRGAVDMKGAIAAFVGATAEILSRHDGRPPAGSISLLITGDEEGPSINGTRKMLAWLAERGETLDACIVGEPTSGEALGDTVKIGRRGSLSATLTVYGTQGHSAYPQYADNPIHRMVRMLDAVTAEAMDEGSEHFEATTLQVTTIDVGNPAGNVIPAKATAALNVRFNDLHSGEEVERWVRERLDREGAAYDLQVRVSGESFLSPPGPLSDALSAAVRECANLTPELGTGGGTSDARFIKDYCPVAELGLKNGTAHKVDEQAARSDIETLTAIYAKAIERFLQS
ncbi:MAG: succinyl-diaminopimelate desuccinylase [Rhodovibrionaceae bacterium]|nr:succinyl-diaminopimelate desuccinylase [Rhodovibrionaceae bacterium]